MTNHTPTEHLSTSAHNSREGEVQRLLTELAQAQAVLKLRKEKPPPLINTNMKFRRFQRTYFADPEAFVHDIFDFREHEGPNHYQNELLATFIPDQRKAIYGPRGLGKTTLGSWLVWYGVLTAEDAKVPTTASAWRQLKEFLWPEVHKWYHRIRWDKVGRPPLSSNRELKTMQIELNGKLSSAFAVASNDNNKIEGAHAADRVLVIFDESKAIVDQMFDSMEGAHSKVTQPLALAMSTPGPKLGRFYDICSRKDGYEDWTVHHVTIDDAIRAGRVDPRWVEQRRRQWGDDSAIFRNHVLGEFASDAEQTVIPIHFVELAEARWDYIMKEGKLGQITSIGVDPARGGGDKTVVAIAASQTIVDLLVWDYPDTMQIADGVSTLLSANPLAQAIIDVIGLGAGVFDALNRRFPDRVLPFNSAERTDSRDRSGQIKFKNKRAYAWWKMREILDPGYNSQVALPEDDELKGELTTPQYSYVTDAMLIQSKDDIRRTLSRSTDKADAVILALTAHDVCDFGSTEVLTYSDYINSIGEVYDYA